MHPSWLQVTSSLLGYISCTWQITSSEKFHVYVFYRKQLYLCFSAIRFVIVTWHSLIFDLSQTFPLPLCPCSFCPRMKEFELPDPTQMNSVLLLREQWKSFLPLEIAGQRDIDS